jgi:hypothetical protein
MDYTQLLFTPPSPIQTHALIFLLGSLTVSSLSDLKRLAAQADFAEVWVAFTAVMLLTDIYMTTTSHLNPYAIILKWMLILLLTVTATSTHQINISTMDVAALTALLSTLNPAYIILTLILTLIANELLQPILRKYGEAGAYPFLPTILTVNLIILLITQTGGIEPYIGITTETL